jgi:nucleoside-diphosphate-sugar epimerase
MTADGAGANAQALLVPGGQIVSAITETVSDVRQRRRVLVTGASGSIGTVVCAALGRRWEIHAADLRPGPGVEPLDVSDPAQCSAAVDGMDAVVHLAANPSPEATWEELYAPNVQGTYFLAAAAREQGVPRLVLASSLQAVSAIPNTLQRRTSDAPRPANLYGATKAWAEAIGSWVASTSQTSVVALRIGHYGAEPPSGDEASPRNLAAWLSPRDAAELVRAAVEAEVSGLTVVNGVSANRYRAAELDEQADQIGYQPIDDTWRSTTAGSTERPA